MRTLLVREMERTHECIILCTDKEKPDMYHLEFPTKSDLNTWISTIGAAKNSAPHNVRFAPGRKSEDILKKDDEFNEEPHNQKVQDWQDDLLILFGKCCGTLIQVLKNEIVLDERKQKEELLRDYMIGRMRFFDDVRTHFKKFPIRHINTTSSSLPSAGAMIERRETRDLEKVRFLLFKILMGFGILRYCNLTYCARFCFFLYFGLFPFQ